MAVTTGTARTPALERYEAVIGIEVHCQLKTASKMFCGCSNSYADDPPNTHCCPVCLGLPGALPVINKRAVEHVLATGAAIHAETPDATRWDRKNYFYPDLPKGYQISQYDLPLCRGGQLGDVRLHRVHLEEDAAKLIHIGASGRIHGSDASEVDFNRGGTPLAEIVTEPDLRDAESAAEWLRLLRATLKATGVSDVNMEEGSLRIDGNISIRPVGQAEFGTKTELKNMNSFRFLERGLDAEIARQLDIVRNGGEVEQETLHFDPQTGSLSSLRSKEEAHDYRYFPEPDLVPVAPTEAMLKRATDELPELPSARAERLERDHSLPTDQAHLLAFRGELGDYFEEALASGSDGATDPTTLANWVTSELVARLGDADPQDSKVDPAALAQLVALVSDRKISRDAGKEVLDALAERGGDPAAVVEERGLAMQDADELSGIVDAALAANPKAVEQFKAGKGKAIGAIVGFVMRETKGRADGGEVNRLIREKIG